MALTFEAVEADRDSEEGGALGKDAIAFTEEEGLGLGCELGTVLID